MIGTLRKRPRPDNAAPDVRSASANTGRLIYLALLFIFVSIIANVLWGEFVILRADGLVLRDQAVVEATYLAEIESVAVREGQKIAKGDPILRLRSIEILERLAELSAQHANLVQRAAEFRTRALVATQLTPLSQRREREARSAVESVERLAKDGLTTAVRREQALRALYDAREARLLYAAQADALANDIPSVEKAKESAAAALADLLQQYSDGVVRAPAAGVVGATAPSPGEVYHPGEPMLVVHSGAPYCLVYLPSQYLFPIREGARVVVRNGWRSAAGVIDEILPVSGALPKEFQNTFRPQDRNQLAKIRFEGATPFSIGEKVSVRLKVLP